MKKMKVLFLANLPSPYRVWFFNELGKLCDLTVIYERRTAKDRNEKWTAESKHTYQEITLNGIKTGTDSALCPGILKFLKKGVYDHIVVSIYSTPTAMLAIEYMRLRKIPFILSTDGGFVSEDSKIKYFIKKHFIGSASHWLSTGDGATDYLEYYGADRNRTYKYPFTSLMEADLATADHCSREEKAKLREKLQMKERYILLTVGQMIYRKGFDVLIRTARALPEDIGIYIVGGEPTAELKTLAEPFKQIHFVDFMRKTELADYYCAADVFVLPTREDVWGLVINEAMCYGLPVITTDRCLAGLELVEDGDNGYIVPADDVKALSDAIMRINLEQTDRMRTASRETIKGYTIEKMAQRHVEVFRMIQEAQNESFIH